MDWVPMFGYGDTVTVNPGSQETLSLMDPLLWSDPAFVEGRIEDENKAYRCERIVGQWMMGGTPSNGEVNLRLWPGYQRPDVAGVVVPGAIDGTAGRAEIANSRWWWERRISGNAITAQLGDWMDPFSHPWWTLCDARCKAWLNEDEVPCLSVENLTLNIVRFRFFLRLLVFA